MNTTELINAVSAHLHNIITQSYTVCALDLVNAIVDAGKPFGLNIMGGAYDCDTRTRVLYIEKSNR